MDILKEFSAMAQELRVLHILVHQNGELIARMDWDEECRRNQYSASKSFTSTAVGIAQKEGLLSLNERLVDCFYDELPDKVCPQLEAATVRDLLTMCLGQSEPQLMGGKRPFLPEKDWVRYALAQPFSDFPGERFLYSNAGPYLAGILVQKRAGCDLVHYLYPRLFAPMGISLPTWETDPLGRTFGAGGLFLCASELAEFGELWRCFGEYNGRQLVPADYVLESTSKQAETGKSSDASAGYGYLFWLGKNASFRADGKYGQVTLVFRDKNAVVTYNAESRDAVAIKEAVMEKIYPLL